MKNIIKRIVCSVLIASLLSLNAPCLALFGDSAETINVIVAIDKNAELSKCKAEIKGLIPEAEFGFDYTDLLWGFSAKIPFSKLELLQNAVCVENVFNDTEYSPLSLEEYEDIVIYAPGLEPAYFPDRGAGSVVAILDDGFFLKHPLFTLGNNSDIKITERSLGQILNFTKASKLNHKTDIKNTYINEKIPFAFDYAGKDFDVSANSSHGTAMLALAAANPQNNEILSAAPSAQALAMKIYPDTGENASTSTIIAALEDARILGADSVCLSLGSPCGFSDNGLYDTLLESVIDKLYNEGIVVVCPAGNDGALGKGSVFDNHYGYFESPTLLPDSGTVNAPSTSKSALSAGSANTFRTKAYAFKLKEDNTYIPFSDSNHTISETGEEIFYTHFNGQTLEYVVINGLGSEEDFTQNGQKLDLTGKVALIERGVLTFAEKVANAAACGAVAAIIYDNEDDSISSLRTAMQLDGTTIPAVFISRADGELMKSVLDKKIIIDSKINYVTDLGITPSPSSFSSRGPTPTLDIKPELSALGGLVTVLNRDGKYSSISGSSAAAAFSAGLAAAVSTSFSGYTGKEKAERIKTTLMNAASVMVETDENETKYYSVTLQGAGYLSEKTDISPEIAITSNSSAKILLGNNLGTTFDAVVELENLTDVSQSITLSSIIGCESYESENLSELCTEKDSFYKANGILLYDYLNFDKNDQIHFTGNYINEFANASVKYGRAELNLACDNFTGAEITLLAKEKRSITLSFDISRENLDELSKVFKNGMLVEGYIFAKAENTYSVPLLGCYGDFYAMSPFDSFLHESGGFFGGSYLYTYYGDEYDDYSVVLGTNYNVREERKASTVSKELVAISPCAEGADGEIFLRLSLLRNLKKLRIDIYSPNGERVCPTIKHESLKKAYVGENGELTNSYSFALWNCRDKNNPRYVYEDGKYICTIVATDASGRDFTENIPFVVDSQKPALTDYSITKDNGRTFAAITVQDNSYIKSIEVFDFNGAEFENITANFPDDSALVNLGKNREFTVSFDITEHASDYIYARITDMAFNKSLVRIPTE